jgi:hypothetical protein
MEDTRDKHQITRDGRYSYVGLGHILPNRILTCHLSSLMSCIYFYCIENGRQPMDSVIKVHTLPNGLR